MKKFFIETYGCQMNTAESNALENILIERGLIKADKAEDADVAIINTCSVRQSAENRIWGRLGAYTHYKSIHPMTLVLTGCMAERLSETIKKDAPQIDFVVPINDKLAIADIIEGKPDSCSEHYDFTKSYYHSGDFSSYVPIMNGCNNFCSYCIVPYVRGREVSRDPNQILNEICFLEEKKVKEITLLGQNVNSYSYNGIDFPDLLNKISEKCSSIKWIRFESPHPKDFSEKLIDTIASNGRIAKHLHIPMQSGSTNILNAMNRHYTAQSYINLIDSIRTKIPDVTFAVDVMVGFPGETERDFLDTMDMMDKVGYIEAYMYYWNPREGTRAVSMPNQVPLEEKQRRLQSLIEFQLKKQAEIKNRRTGSVQKFLVTGVSRDNSNMMLGHNEHMESAVFESASCVGSFTDVQVVSLNGNTFVGKEV